MSKNLVIVESPAKSKTIGKFLGKDYEIKASFGHIRDLPDRKLGVDIDDHFKPTYGILKGKTKVVQELKAAAEKAETVYIATDPDREGEAIAWHIQAAIKQKASKVKRIVFNEITKNAIQHAITHCREIDSDMVDAQQARRVLDRLIGYKLSPILAKKIRKGLSAGRVQSVAVRMICDRENEIKKFIPKEYWVIETELETADKKAKFTAKLFAVENVKGELEVANKEQADAILAELKTSKYKVQSVKKTQVQRHPYAPFITSTLQQEASRKLNWSAKKTMAVAQKLYEEGLITYMRTDSTRLSADATQAAKKIITDVFGKNYLPENPRIFKQKANVQDAHEAIRPAYPEKFPKDLGEDNAGDNLKLYKLVWERFMASQMASAILDQTQILVLAKNNDKKPGYVLKATGSVVKFDGFTRLYQESSDHSSDKEEKEQTLPVVNENDPLGLYKIDSAQKFTQPPHRYTEASLVKAMEEDGIGRPSTYAPTLAVIQDRGYVNKEKKTLFPTDLGMLVNEKLVQFFDHIIEVPFTASMETKLDEIMEGKHVWYEVVQDIYDPFSKMLKTAGEEMEKVNTDKPSDEICDKCGHPMIIKTGRFGEFLACSNFPECKNTRSILIDVGVKCPECSKPVIEKHSRKGKVFYGCSGYPNCKFASWDKPLAEACPTCNAPIMYLKKNKFGKEKKYCKNCDAKPAEAA